MSRRFWILGAMCVALALGTFTPQEAQAGWRHRYFGRVHRYGWRHGFARFGGWRHNYAWRGGWRRWNRGYGGFGFGGSYLAGFGSSYGAPYLNTYSTPYSTSSYSVSTYSVSPYFGGAPYAMSVASTPGFYSYAASRAADPATSFIARFTALINKTSREQSKTETSFVARHSSDRKSAVESNASLENKVISAGGYGYGLPSSSGYSYKSQVVSASQDHSSSGLSSVAMNR